MPTSPSEWWDADVADCDEDYDRDYAEYLVSEYGVPGGDEEDEYEVCSDDEAIEDMEYRYGRTWLDGQTRRSSRLAQRALARVAMSRRRPPRHPRPHRQRGATRRPRRAAPRVRTSGRTRDGPARPEPDDPDLARPRRASRRGVVA